MDRTLARIFEDVGDGAFDALRCEPESETYRDIPQTTWLELEGLGYVRAAYAIGSPGYLLTGEGWIAALKASGAFDSEGWRARAVALRARLLQVMWTADHLDVALEHRGRVFRVPARFGSKRLLYEAGPFPDPLNRTGFSGERVN